MSLESLKQAFTPNAQQVTELTVSVLPDIAKLLSSLDITALTFTGASVSLGQASVTLAGQVSWRGSTGRASLVGSVLGTLDRLVFDLNIATPKPWTLGASFPELPAMWRDDNGIRRAPSYIPALQVNLPTLHASNLGETARLSGGLPLIGDLQPYASYVGPGELMLDGEITFGADNAPQLVLDAMSSTAQSRPAGFSGAAMNGIGLRITTLMPDDLSIEPDTFMSALLLVAKMSFKGQPVEVTCPLLWGNFVWPLYANLWQAKPTLGDGLSSLATLLGLQADSFELPPSIDITRAFYLAELGVGIIPPSPGSPLPGIEYLRAVIGSDQEWSPPIPYVRVGGLGASWVFSFGGKRAMPDLAAQVWGEMRLGSKNRASRSPVLLDELGNVLSPADPVPDYIVFKISVNYPGWLIEGRLLTADGSNAVPVKSIFEAFNFGSAPDTGLIVRGLTFQADPRNQVFHAEGAVQGNWTLNFGGLDITLSELGAWITASQSSITGGIKAFFYLDPTGQNAVFSLSAEYRSNGRWLFKGGLATPLSLIDLLVKAFKITPPSWVAAMNITLTKLDLMLDTGDAAGGSYRAEGTVAAKWHINALGISDLALLAKASVEKTPALLTPNSSVRGSFAINKFMITAGVDIRQSLKTYLFSVRYEELELRATTAWIKGKDGADDYQVLNVQLRGVTLGDILTYFVRLASPASQFSLEAPWNLLNKIDLADFVLTLDKFHNIVSLSYNVEADFGFIYVKSVGVRYTSSGKGKVDLILSGRILDQKYGYDGEPELSWDVVNDPPPAIPGKGPRLLELRYMGVGQHVTLKKMRTYTTLQQVINALRTEMLSADNPDQNPIDQIPELQFDSSSQWMVGFDFTVLDTVSVSLVLHDPDLYGILIALGGPKAGSLAGFSFELLYRKVTDDIGVFRVQLKVPDAFRQIELGPVSLTLGVITVEVYTNGNFMVDLGFPHSRSFAESFAVQVFPFIGRGGVYFARLTGATSRRVPVISNGNFEPVLELGVGLAVGLGKEFNKGPLSAGLYVELEVIIEGVLAWFHPSDTAVSADRYHWIQGMAGITGKLYGCIDFKIIKVSLSIELHAFAMVTLEAYKACIVDMEVGVEAHASIKILFIRIHFSFSLTIHETFTLGHDQRAPWIVSGASGNARQISFKCARPVTRRTYASLLGHTQHAYLMALHSARPQLRARMEKDSYVLNWDPDFKAFVSPRVVTLRLMALPAINQLSVAFAPETPAPNLTPDYRVSIMLTADSGNDGHGDGTDGPHALLSTPIRSRTATALLSSQAVDVPDLGMNVLIEAFLRWAVNALPSVTPSSGVAVAGELALLAEQMTDPRTANDGFAMSHLARFMENNVRLHACLPPDASSVVAIGLAGAAFPLPPTLSWVASQPDRSRDFATYNRVDSGYEKRLDDWFNKLNPLPVPAPAPVSALADTVESVASFVFRDSLLMLAKTAVEEAQALMRAWPYQYEGSESLTAICEYFQKVSLPYFKHAGDTVEQVGAYYGFSLAELTSLDPHIQSKLDATPVNGTLQVLLGVTPMSVAASNADTYLALNNALPIGDVPAQVRTAPPGNAPPNTVPVAETLDALATRFGKTPGQLATEATLASTRLLRPQAPFDVSTLVFANPGALSLDQAAATLFVRLHGIAVVAPEDYQTQVQIISENNPQLTGVNINTILHVSEVNLSATVGDVWAVQVGDTLARIAATVALLRSAPSDAYRAFNSALKAINPGNQPVKLPAGTLTAVEVDECIADVAQRLLLSASPAVIALLAGADVLLPLAVVRVPAVVISVTASDTLGSVASAYGLSVEDLGTVLATQGSLFNGSPELTVANVPAVGIDHLIDTLQRSHSAMRISGMLSNFLLHGLRPPQPGDDPTPAALHDIIGQQIAPDTDAPMTLSLGAAQGQKWFSYYHTAVSETETLTAFATRNNVPLAPVEALNPGAFARYGVDSVMPAGLVLITQAADASAPATLMIDHSALVYPDASVQLPTVRAPMPMPLVKNAPVTYGLQQHQVWQASSQPWTSTAKNLSPSLWPFPVTLLNKAANPPDYSYELVASAVQTGTSAPKAPTRYGWATCVDIAIRRTSVSSLNEQGSSVLANTYELIGADTAARQTLLALWQSLPVSGGADLYWLYAPPAQSDRAVGLASDELDPARTFIIKTNLSTVTASGRAQRLRAQNDPALPIAGENFAQINAPKAFLTLLWECSVVGGGGYVLGYATPDGTGLPDALFDNDGAATLTLLAIPNPRTKRLTPYFNCAAVADNVDPATTSLGVCATGQVETVPQPVVSPGHIGFDFALSNPDLLEGQTVGQQLARQSYSLAGYALQATDAFSCSATAMPVGPLVSDSQAKASGVRALRDEPTWYFHQVVPISRYATRFFAPPHPNLPAPEDDPYAGIAALWTPAVQTPASARIDLWFQDLLGNISHPGAQGVKSVTPMVGYTDTLKAPGQWPNVAIGYQINPAGAQANLSVVAAVQLSTCLPGPGDSPAAVVASAASHRTSQQALYYQLAQPDIQSVLTTNLAVESVNGTLQPIALDGGLVQLRAMVAAYYVLLDLIAGTDAQPGLGEVWADTSRFNTFDAILQNYGLTTDDRQSESGYQLLARANAQLALYSLLWGASSADATLSLPVFTVVREGSSLAQLFATQALAISTLGQPQNTHLPLRLGQTLKIPVVTKAVSAAATSSLFQVAQALICPVADLAQANSGASGLLRAGFAFVYQGITAKVGLGDDGKTVSLQAIADALTARGYPVSAVDLASLNQYSVGLFADQSQVQLDSYITQPLDSIGSNDAGLSITELVQHNFDSGNLLDAGIALYTGSRSDVAVPVNQPLEQFASAQGLTAVQVLQALATLPLAATATVQVPGAACWSRPGPLQVPYTIRPADTLSGIANLFSVAGASVTFQLLANVNCDLPGVLSDTAIRINGVSVTPQDGSSFNRVVAQFSGQGQTVTVEQIATQIASVAGHLYPGGLLLCPLTRLGDGQDGFALDTLTRTLGVSSADFCAVNAAMPGLILPNVALTLKVANPQGGPDLSISTTTRSHDTLNSIAARFTAMGAPTCASSLGAANPGAALINPAARPALPVTPVHLTRSFGPGAQGAWAFTQSIFEIEVALTFRRSPNLIDPGFKSKEGAAPGAVEKAVTLIAPASSLGATQAAAIGTPVSLAQFALNLEAAIPAVRVASGKVLKEGSPGNDIWAVVFTGGGIDQLTVAPTYDAGLATGAVPWFFAIRPLSTDLVSAPRLLIKPLVNGALSGTGIVTNVSGVDIETWARTFLADFDRLLSPAYTSGIYRLSSAAIRNRIDELINCKSTLAGAISAGLDFVLTAPDLAPARRDSAVSMLNQRLLTSLSQGYDVSLVMQWDVTAVKTPWNAASVRLAGSPTLKKGGAPNVSIGATKIVLADQSSADFTPFINATLTVTNAQAVGTLTFEADLTPNEIEFDIADVEGVTGYVQSKWLRFAHPLTDNPPQGYSLSLGTVVAPLPLRSYPALPQLKAQTTRPQDPATVDIATAAQWRYDVEVMHPGVLQDELVYDIQVNIQPTGMKVTAAKDPLIAALAQYTAVQADLWAILDQLTDARPAQPLDPILIAAINTFIDQADAISQAWARIWQPASVADTAYLPRSGTPQYRRYRLSSRLEATGGLLRNLVLSGDANHPGPGGWPNVSVSEGAQGRAIVLAGQEPVGGTRYYKFPPDSDVPTNIDLVYALDFHSLASGLYQNAQTAVAVVRNAYLMPAGGPATREPFIFRTPSLAFADKVTPLIINSNRLPIAHFSSVDPQALIDMFNQVFAGNSTEVQVCVAVSYNYRLVEVDVGDPLTLSLPVLLMPRSDYAPTLPGQLASSLQIWQNNNSPSSTGGEWQISISLYSTIEPGLDRPILQLERVISNLR